MKEKLSRFLDRPSSVVVVLLLATLLSLADRNFGYFFGLAVVIFIVWQRNWDWSHFGYAHKITGRTVLKGIGLAVVSFLAFAVFEYYLQQHFGAFDLSSVEDIRGDFVSYLILMLIMWIFAAFGEELLFRGYYMQGFARLFGNTELAWVLAGVLTSLYFGVSHAYQGVAGVIAVATWSLFISFLYYRNRDNLALVALVHGFYDTIGLTLIHLNRDTLITDWLLG